MAKGTVVNTSGMHLAVTICRNITTRLGRLSAVACVLILGVAPAEAEYHVDVGDVLDISAPSAPELHTMAKIDVDGAISVPVVGSIEVAGLTLTQLRDKIALLLNERVAATKATEQEHPGPPIASDEIIVAVTEYRSIYVTGKVARPGAQAFRPGMTVRQAIAAAGGLDDGTKIGGSSPGDLQAQYAALWIDFAQEQARIWRLERERDGEARPAAVSTHSAADGLDAALAAIPVPTTVLTKIAMAETDQLTLSLDALTKEHDYLKSAIDETGKQLTLLNQRQKEEQAESDATNRELSTLQSLFKAGWVTLDRVASERRSLLATNNQISDTLSMIAQTQRERREFILRLERLDDGQRATAARDLEDANVKLAKIRGNLQAVGDRIIAVGHRGAIAARLEPENDPRVVSIFRKTTDPFSHISATDDTMLLPGDVVEVDGTDDSAVAQTQFRPNTDKFELHSQN